MTSASSEVDAYLEGLPDDRREVVEVVRATILEHLPEGYEEAVAWGMISYQVPMDRSGPTYNGEPLVYAALASQKRYLALYLNGVYADDQRADEFRKQYVASGKKLDMGKSCVRFRSLEDLPLELIADTIAATPVDSFLAIQAASRA